MSRVYMNNASFYNQEMNSEFVSVIVICLQDWVQIKQLNDILAKLAQQLLLYHISL